MDGSFDVGGGVLVPRGIGVDKGGALADDTTVHQRARDLGRPVVGGVTADALDPLVVLGLADVVPHAGRVDVDVAVAEEVSMYCSV